MTYDGLHIQGSLSQTHASVSVSFRSQACMAVRLLFGSLVSWAIVETAKAQLSSSARVDAKDDGSADVHDLLVSAYDQHAACTEPIITAGDCRTLEDTHGCELAAEFAPHSLNVCGARC